MNKIIQERMTVCYEDVKRFIKGQVKNYRNHCQNGGLAEEAESDANFHFVKAYYSFLPEKAKFITHTGFRVYKGMQGEMRSRFRHRPTLFSELDKQDRANITSNFTDKRSRNSLKDKYEMPSWSDLISKDGRDVILLAFDPPRDIKLFLKERGSEHPKTMRACIREFLLYKGWSNRRVSNAFLEIKKVMK